ncbi:MAG: NAD/NADP octopine/nopaline dehydrogenase family protein [Peptococcales bacterium]
MVKRVAILGAGNGGATAAADLSAQGFEVRLYESPEFHKNIEVIEKKGGILFKTEKGEQFVKIALVTTNISEAIKNADVVMITVPGTAIEIIADKCAPYLEEGQAVLINSAACMASVRFMQTIKTLGVKTNFKIGETNTLTYGTRFFADKGEVHMMLKTKKLLCAAYPSKDTPELIRRVRQLYDFLVPAANVWETTLNNGNPESHPGPSVCNAGRIDYSKGEFWLYKEGMTEHTVNVVKAVDNERAAICKAMGFEGVPKETRIVELGYAQPLENLQRQYNESTIYPFVKGPTDLNSRYITEDIPNGLVLWSSIGKVAGVATPVIDAIITLGGALLGRDFWAEGMSVEKLGFNIASKEDLISQVS